MTARVDGDAPTVPSRGAAPSLHRRTLLVMIGDQIDVRPLPRTGVITIGRSEACDVQVEHGSMSRVHCELRLAEDGVEVCDRGGANGTKLRGVALPTGVAVRISSNEALQAGDVVLVVQEVAATAATTGAAPARATGPRTTGAPVIVDPAMVRLYDLAARVARGAIGVLIVGETGAGKELLAEFVHQRSPRASAPLVRLNCAALTEALVESELFGHERGAFTGAQREHRGLVEAADGGTLFLDEVGELTPALQAKLLRVLEDGRVLRVGATEPRAVDVRFVAATNRDLEAEAAAGRFRRDLYFRLAGAVLAIPPLRERPDEIAVLARRFAADAAAQQRRATPRIDADALAALAAHPWPGNARELRNAIERAVLVADDVILRAHLPFTATSGNAANAPIAPSPPAAAAALSDQLAALERQRILDALDACVGNQTRAAAMLGMPRRTFVKRLDEYGIPRPRK